MSIFACGSLYWTLKKLMGLHVLHGVVGGAIFFFFASRTLGLYYSLTTFTQKMFLHNCGKQISITYPFSRGVEIYQIGKNYRILTLA